MSEDPNSQLHVSEDGLRPEVPSGASKPPPLPTNEKLPQAERLPTQTSLPDGQTARVAQQVASEQSSQTLKELPVGIAVRSASGSVDVRCPSCLATLKFDPLKAGWPGKCGRCKNAFRFPSKNQIDNVAGVVPCPKCGRGAQYHPEIRGQAFDCPHCGRGIRLGALQPSAKRDSASKPPRVELLVFTIVIALIAVGIIFYKRVVPKDDALNGTALIKTIIILLAVLFLGLAIGAVILRAAVSLYNKMAGGANSPTAVPEPRMGNAMSIVFVTAFLNTAAGIIVSWVMNGSATGSARGVGLNLMTQVVSFPISLLVMAGMLSAFLPLPSCEPC